MPERHRAYLRAVTRSAFSALIAMLALAAVTVPASAQACWDGYRATTDRVAFQRGTGRASWNPEHARYATRWAARLEALLPESASLEVSNTSPAATGTSGAPPGRGHRQRRCVTLFDRVAEVCGLLYTRSAAPRSRPPSTHRSFAGSRRVARAFAPSYSSARSRRPPPQRLRLFEEGGFSCE
jgi:hypothetical protein